jgi:hypothetical protein
MAQYYSMLFEKALYVNGKYCNQCEVVVPKVVVKDFGTDNVGCPMLRRCKLEHVWEVAASDVDARPTQVHCRLH